MITYIEPDGTGRAVEVKAGATVMEGAVRRNLPGILAECSGGCSCGTCHIHVDAAWRDLVGPPSSGEADLLEFSDNFGPGSRLSCQIVVTPALDGLIVRIPESQP